MTRIRWVGTFDAAHFIPGHPKCGHLHGHTYRVRVRVDGDISTNPPHFVLDFAALKVIVGQLDHRLLVPSRPGVEYEIMKGGWCRIGWTGGRIQLPSESVAALHIPETSSECLSKWILDEIVAECPNATRIVVEVHETRSTSATACYPARE